MWSSGLYLFLHGSGIGTHSRIKWSSFGELDASYLLTPFNNIGLLQLVLLVNLPQFLISTVYISYSGLLSSMLVSREFVQLTKQGKGLRVSDPRGMQRSTPWLSVPFRYTLPLTGVMALLHWAISESIFLARADHWYSGDNGEFTPSGQIDTICWSSAAVLVSLVIGGLLILTLILLGFKPIPRGTPVLSTNSAAISAACHPAASEPDNAHELLLQYGGLSERDRWSKRRRGFLSKKLHPLFHQEIKEPRYMQFLKKMGAWTIPTSRRKQNVASASIAALMGIEATAAGG